ncbi:MAG: ClbS/DfsB family four-helix bundle protein [Chloroflexota bacterium]|nr:ClbS/DfsB family four-helix bundle protein [Chloroflexota bacterium]
MIESTPSPAVAEAIARIERSWQRLNAELERIPRQRMLEAGAVGVWSIKDLLGHIAYWDNEAPGAGQRHLAGEPDPDYDFDAINAREAALRADRGLDEQWSEMNQAHQAVVAYIRSQSGDEPTALGLCGCLEGYTHEHYDTHAADVRAWRDRAGL